MPCPHVCGSVHVDRYSVLDEMFLISPNWRKSSYLKRILYKNKPLLFNVIFPWGTSCFKNGVKCFKWTICYSSEISRQKIGKFDIWVKKWNFTLSIKLNWNMHKISFFLLPNLSSGQNLKLFFNLKG